MYEIGYAYATSEIADFYGYDHGCAYLREKGKHIDQTFNNVNNDALERAIKWAALRGIEIEPISAEWAKTIINIRSRQR